MGFRKPFRNGQEVKVKKKGKKKYVGHILNTFVSKGETKYVVKTEHGLEYLTKDEISHP